MARKQTPQPDPKTADRVEYVTSDDYRKRGGFDAALIAPLLDLRGWYSYTDATTRERVLLIAKDR